MKLLLTITFVLMSAISFGQLSCPYMTTYYVEKTTDSFRVVYKYVNPTSGAKSFQIMLTSGNDTLYTQCVDASGQKDVERTAITHYLALTPSVKVQFFGYTNGDCGGSVCWQSNTTPLPITLSSFNVSSSNGIVNISWKVASKDKFNRFELERSSNGEEYNLIHTIPDSDKDYYQVNDAIMYHKAYYRLKLVDNDGSSTYSPTRVVMSNSVNKMPFRALINNVPIAAQVNDNVSTQVIVKTITGVTVYSGRIHNGESILIPDMAHGIYIVCVDDNRYKLLF